MLFEDEANSSLPCNADLSEEPDNFEHLAVGEEPPGEDGINLRSRALPFGLAGSAIFHLLLLLALALVVDWQLEPEAIKSLSSFDVSLKGFEPSPRSQTVTADEVPLEPNIGQNPGTPTTTENSQGQSPARQTLIEELAQEPRRQPTASASASDSVDTVDIETPARKAAVEDVDARQPDDSMGAVIVTTGLANRALPITENDVSNEVIETEDLSPVASNEINEVIDTPTQSLTANQLDALEAQVKKWQEDLFDQLQESNEVSWSDNGQQYTATLKEIPSAKPSELDRVEITVTANVNGDELETTVRMKRLAFSHYGQFVNRWDRDTYLHQDEIEGRFHSNGTINIESSRRAKPIFHGPVTVSNSANVDGRGRRSEIFLGGLDTRVRRIHFPSETFPLDQTSMGSRAETVDADIQKSQVLESQIKRIEGDATIVFYSDGSFSWQYKGQSRIERHYMGAEEFYIVAAEDSILSVKGVVKGRVVIFTPEEISITGDIRYADDPEKNPQSADFLGLISEKYVEIAGPDITGPGDLTIYAAIYAKRRFSVRRFRNRNEGLLTIYGSLSAGSLSATEPRFATLLRFDQRFEHQRPPGFPMTNRYELDHWDKQWRIVN